MRHPVPDPPTSTSAFAALIDHTLAVPEATPEDVDIAARTASELGCAALVVHPARLPVVSGVPVCALAGFPSGAHGPEVKSAETAYAVLAGATEIEMVVDLGLVKASAWTDLEDEIATVRTACGTALLKVVVESALWNDDQLARAAEAAGRGGADYVVTSTGFHPAGGATEKAVRLLRSVVGDELGVKASGGITDIEPAVALIRAGASRIGCAGTPALLAGFGS